VTAFPEDSQGAGKNGKDKREMPLNLLALPASCELRTPHRPRARHTRSVTWQAPKAKEVSIEMDLGGFGGSPVDLSQ
jgi:hypothetical protein